MALDDVAVAQHYMTAVPAKKAERTSRKAERSSRKERQAEEAAAWYRDHGPAILRYLRYLVGDQELAEDLLQETFAAAFANRRQFRREGSPRTWLRTIALNGVRRHARRQAMRPAIEAAGQAQASPPEATDGPARSSQWLEVLDRALAGLTPEQREAFVLRNIEELPVAECAEILGTAVSTISKRARKAEAIVRKALEDEG